MRKARVQRGERVLIDGASGAVGTYAVQLARHLGATVTAVCGPSNQTLVRSLGAAHVLDYTREDFAQLLGRCDVIFDAVGKLPAPHWKQALEPVGRYLSVHAASGSRERAEDLRSLAELIEAGVLRPVIDRCYPLEEIVEAHRYVDTGRKKGNMAILVAGPEEERYSACRARS